MRSFVRYVTCHQLINKESRRSQMQGIINHTQSDDASHLRPVIGSYAVPNPKEKVVHPPVPARSPKDTLGFGHPELALLLCPIRHLNEMLEHPME